MNEAQLGKPFPIPVVALGPGSQSSDDDGLEYLSLPSEMDTFRLPVAEVPADAATVEDCRSIIAGLRDAMQATPLADGPVVVPLAGAAAPTLRLLNQSLGEGEVSIIVNGATPARIQETVFASVWRVFELAPDGSVAADRIEAGAIPEIVRGAALAGTTSTFDPGPAPAGVMNSPALLREIADRSARYRPDDAARVINLSLLPTTPEDLDYLTASLGAGSVAILSRGYGACRIASTVLPNVWWVQYFNSMNAMILNSIEIVDVPEVALAAAEDYADSIDRLGELHEVMAEN